MEEFSEEKLSDLGRCLYGHGFNDGEKTMKGEPASLSRMIFPCDEGVDGFGDLIGHGFNDGENTIKGELGSLSRMLFPCNEGMDGVGDLIDMDCMAWSTKIGENAVLLLLFRRGNAFIPLFSSSSLELIAVKVLALKAPFGTPTYGLTTADTIVWAPRFRPLLDDEGE